MKNSLLRFQFDQSKYNKKESARNCKADENSLVTSKVFNQKRQNHQQQPQNYQQQQQQKITRQNSERTETNKSRRK